MTRRYGRQVQPYRLGLAASTLRALNALVPSGHRAEFCDAAIRRALGQRAAALGAGTLPGEALSAIAQTLRDAAEQLDRHAKKWGEAP